MHLLAFFLLGLLCLINPAVGSVWNLVENVQGETFFESWDFDSQDQPIGGFAEYVTASVAVANGYVATRANNDTYIGCDHTHIASSAGRQSVRLNSKARYPVGSMFMLYLSHMPTGCGTWPAWWTEGPNNPEGGEIDIIEQVNTMHNARTTLHTTNGCDYTNASVPYTGYPTSTQNCTVSNGCNVYSRNEAGAGNAFNQAGGGLFVTSYTRQGIKSWLWSEGSIPSNALSDDPRPETWGEQYAYFPFGQYCSANHFANQTVILNLAFCGSWVGRQWDNECDSHVTCEEFVKLNPHAFKEAYWLVHWMKVFAQNEAREQHHMPREQSAQGKN